jgi:hypothetical protein
MKGRDGYGKGLRSVTEVYPEVREITKTLKTRICKEKLVCVDVKRDPLL